MRQKLLMHEWSHGFGLDHHCDGWEPNQDTWTYTMTRNGINDVSDCDWSDQIPWYYSHDRTTLHGYYGN